METVIYNNTNPENHSPYDAVGQVADSGIVYTSPFMISATTAVGQIDNGVVYNRVNAKSWEFAVGHVSATGIIYSTPVTEYNSDAIGHVNSNGVVYRTPYSEYNSDIVGHVQGPDKRAAAAALLLLLKGAGSDGGSGYSAGAGYQGESIVAKATGALTELDFDIYDRLHGRVKPCRSCGKKVTLSKYQSQNEMCFWCDQLCKAAEEVRKKMVAEGRSGATTGKTICPLCGTRFRVNYPSNSSVVTTWCPNEKCGAALRVTNGMKRAEKKEISIECPLCGTRFNAPYPIGNKEVVVKCPCSRCGVGIRLKDGKMRAFF